MCQFSLKRYLELIKMARDAGYDFIDFDQVSGVRQKSFGDEKTTSLAAANGEVEPGMAAKCLLRHDVDGDLAAAVRMAEKEAELGISATYFLMWRSPCYNLMSRANQNYAELILSLGHKVGLHYDQGFDEINKKSRKETSAAINQQVNWIGDLLDCEIKAVSFHQPNASILQAAIDCGPYINTYDKEKLSAFEYLSDSNRRFPLWESLPVAGKISCEAALASMYPRNIQLLIHPMWWVYEDRSTEEVWNQVLLSNFERMETQLLETERAFGKKRAFKIE